MPPMPRIARRSLLAATLLPFGAQAQGFPDRNVRLIVPFTPAGQTDIMARLIALRLQDAWGKPVVVENRPGGNALIGADAVAKAAPDGNTILVHSNAHVIAPALVSRLPYDPIGDFAPIAHLGRIPQVMVINPRLPVQDMAGLLAMLRANPGKHHFASAGIGSAVHLAGEVFRAVAGVDIQPVHYRGGGPAMQAVITGEVVFTIDPVASATSHIRAGTVRPITIAGPERVPSLPEVPSSTEAGLPALQVEAWVMAWAPARTPPAAVAALQAAFTGAVQGAAPRLAALGVQPSPILGQAALTAFLREDMTRSVAVLQAAGVRPD